jgi:2-dehydro-3-deoxyphosphogluconate aldolase/(4S)-4-hydroxy-2-oxoglutarate aldolase
MRGSSVPLDDVPLIPTGGVRIDEIADYLAAGALAVGMGSPLLGDAVASGDLSGLWVRAESALAVAREASA